MKIQRFDMAGVLRPDAWLYGVVMGICGLLWERCSRIAICTYSTSPKSSASCRSLWFWCCLYIWFCICSCKLSWEGTVTVSAESSCTHSLNVIFWFEYGSMS